MFSSKLSSRLSDFLGHHAAKQELRWMQQKSSHPPTLKQMVERRLKGEPLQYILGTQPFGALDLLVRPPVLIPRPETEDWTIRLAKLFKPSPARPIKLLDLCTGTGCIPLLLCHLWPQGSTDALGVDVAEEAIELAQDNAKRCGISLAIEVQNENRDLNTFRANTFRVQQADILQPQFLEQLRWKPIDVLTSNPPYIPQQEYDELPTSVKDYEDKRALLGDPEQTPSDGRGLTFYRAFAKLIGSNELIKPGGVVALEVGRKQSEEVQNLMMTQAGMRKSEVWRDPWGVPRTVISWK